MLRVALSVVLLVVPVALGCGETSSEDGPATVSPGAGTGGASGSGGATPLGSGGSGGGTSTGGGTVGAPQDGGGGGDAAASGGDAGTVVGPGSDGGSALDALVRLNHLQLAGTHNSYHQMPAVPFDPSHAYQHPTLTAQMEAGVRAFELDVHRSGQNVEVYHIVLIDELTSCRAFVDCLGEIRDYSDAHPAHVPIVVWIEVKDATGGETFVGNLGLIDRDIVDVLGARVLTPDELQGSHASPRAAVDADGWPALGDVRGRILFVLLNAADHGAEYSASFTEWAGRAMFVRAEPSQYADSWAVVTKIDDPADGTGIRAALDAGLLVASNTCGAGGTAAECTAEREAGFANGSTTLHDDFVAAGGAQAAFAFPEGTIARCNPITSSADCESALLE